ncbi:MAG: glycoside hydrolase family 20 zincin-like fold domain-containing protein, partial [Christensenellales bacterium]
MNILPRVKKIYGVHGEAGKDRSYRRDDTVPNEGYRIEADEKGTVVVFSDEAGKFYAEKTLAQIERGEGKIP